MPDRETLLDVLVAAFVDDPLYRWLYADPSTRPVALRANMALTLDLAHERGRIDSGGSASAVAVWTEPGVELLDDPQPFVDLLERFAPGKLETAMQGMAACASYARADDHTLHLLAVHPNHQNRGAAVRLLHPQLHELDDDGASAYVESSNARNVGFYQRAGFVPLAEVPVGAQGPLMRPMRRRPRERTPVDDQAG